MVVKNLRCRRPLIPGTLPNNPREAQHHHPGNKAPLLPDLTLDSRRRVDLLLDPLPPPRTHHEPRSTISSTGPTATREMPLGNRPSPRMLNNCVVLESNHLPSCHVTSSIRPLFVPLLHNTRPLQYHCIFLVCYVYCTCYTRSLASASPPNPHMVMVD